MSLDPETEARTTTDSGVVKIDSIPERVYQHLISAYGTGQQKRVQGYFASQSLRKLLEYVDAEDIEYIYGERRVRSESEDLPTLGTNPFLEYTTLSDRRVLSIEVKYDRRDVKQPFDAEGILGVLEDEPLLYDIPVRHVVFRMSSGILYDQLSDLLKEAVKFSDMGEFEQPFFAEMKSCSPGSETARQRARDIHDDRYFKARGEDYKDGICLDWPIRTLDLKALWSLNAWNKSGRVVGKKGNGDNVNMRELEDLAFNYYESDERKFGAVNSKLVVGKWMETFTQGVADIKKFDWREKEGWVQRGSN